MISPWVFEFFHELTNPEPSTDRHAIRAHFEWYLDLWTKMEPRGFEGIFFSEHHFGAAYSPSPNLAIAAMAGRTTTLRLGSLGAVSTHTTPWRVAEEFAMLDHLTGGRLEMGVVAGIPPEQLAIGQSPAEAHGRHEEVCNVLEQSLRGPVVTHHGTNWNIDNLRLTPTYFQESPSVWTAVRSAESSERAARRGWKAVAGFASTKEVTGFFNRYRAAAEDASRSTEPSQLGVRRLVTFVDDPNDQAAGVQAGKHHLLGLLNQSVGPLPPFAAVLDKPSDQMDGPLSIDEFISGTPEQVAEQLIEQCRTIGAANAVVMFGVTDHEGIERHHQLFSEHVIPELRKA
jgi:alkanesulfonate monooxygenase SsuD/methylene tetrahydromethanopterin reductase-like flavin-dependent oxidoreductase (luciferase family)